MTDDPLADLAAASDQIATLIAGVTPEQYEMSTPCQSWDVQALLAHLFGDLDNFMTQATGGKPNWGAPPPQLPTVPAAAFRAGADRLLDAWRAAGELTGTITTGSLGEVPARMPVDQQICEFTVHAWDLRMATGQATPLDPGLAETALAWGKTMLRPEFRGDEASGKGFGPEVTVPDDAPSYDRLVAFYGRHPA
jgi:uncharacterized protein (TIGR03086 family)